MSKIHIKHYIWENGGKIGDFSQRLYAFVQAEKR